MIKYPYLPNEAGWYWGKLRETKDWICFEFNPSGINHMDRAQVFSERECCLLLFEEIGPKLEPPND
jgi:hypothetical protein